MLLILKIVLAFVVVSTIFSAGVLHGEKMSQWDVERARYKLQQCHDILTAKK
jgi:hypothetical protein